jgi:hypothetical protein
LPHSIIVTEEGVEGEVDLAAQVQADVTTAPVELAIPGDTMPAAQEATVQGKKSAGVKVKDVTLSKGKTAKTERLEEPKRPGLSKQPQTPKRSDRPAPRSKPRGKK